jgi:hypothetical protein
MVTSLAVAANGQVAPGTPSFSAFDSHEVDTVDLLNNNIALSVPVMSKAGALPFNFNLAANSYMSSRSNAWWPSMAYGIGTLLGAPFLAAADNFVSQNSALATYTTSTNSTCNGLATVKYMNWIVQDYQGTVHHLPSTDYTTSTSGSGCVPTFTDITNDNSGITLTASGSSVTSVYDRSGNSLPLGWGSIVDPNGNSVGLSTAGGNWFWKDSIGLTVISSSGFGTPTYSWTDVNGGSPAVSQSASTNLTLKTAYSCGITDINNSSSTALTSGFSFPDGTSLGLTYETTPGFSPKVTGRLSKLTLREGGTITYTYGGTHNGIDCTYQTVPTLTRTLGNGDVTTYSLSYSLISGSNYKAVNDVTNPGGNHTLYQFTGFTSTGNSSTYAPVLTQVKKYQGAASGTPLTIDVYCYNAAFASCSTSTAPTAQVSLPITSVVVFHQVSGRSDWSATERHFDAYGNVTYSASYDFGGTSPVRATTTTYYQSGTSCGALSTGSNINDKPCEISTAQNGSTVADAKYTYDAHGNLLTTSLWTGSTWLSNPTANAYNTNGTPTDTYDFANNHTQYTYSSLGYSVQCTGATQYPFPTKLKNVGANLDSNYAYDCTGGMMIDDQDPSRNDHIIGYSSGGVADPYWRPVTISGPYGIVSKNVYRQCIRAGLSLQQ